jgi:hypothetical protein
MTTGYISTREMKNTERGYNNGTQKRSRSRRSETLYPDSKAGKKYQRPTEGLTRRHPTVSNTNQRKEVT